MKLSPADYDRYYESLGIKESDILSPQSVDLAELPAGIDLTDTERGNVGGFIRQWNQMADPREKVDAAQAVERRVLRGRDPERMLRADASLAYLMLGRIRGHEDRREVMRRIACGEMLPPVPKARSRGRRSAAPSFREQVDARLRANGVTGVIIEPIEVKRANGDTITIHHMRPRRD